MTTPRWALERISEARETRSSALDLSCASDSPLERLEAVPTEVQTLRDLEKLNLSGHFLNALPDWLANLTNLTWFNLSRTTSVSCPTH